MPTVQEIGPYRFFFVSLERAGGFNRTELSRIATPVLGHREVFLERWSEFFSDSG